MPKATLQPSQSRGVYRFKNWPEYNAGLIERGNVTGWMNERMFSPAPQTPSQRGRPQAYCDGMIQMLLTLTSVYRLLQRLAMADLAVPSYSTLSRGAKSLRVTLLVLRNAGEAVHLLVDSTGLKLFGESE